MLVKVNGPGIWWADTPSSERHSALERAGACNAYERGLGIAPFSIVTGRNLASGIALMMGGTASRAPEPGGPSARALYGFSGKSASHRRSISDDAEAALISQTDVAAKAAINPPMNQERMRK